MQWGVGAMEIYDDARIKEHYERICSLIDDSAPFVSLNVFFRDRFMLDSISTLFYQGEARFLASMLMMDDHDARRMLITHLLDNILPPFSD